MRIWLFNLTLFNVAFGGFFAAVVLALGALTLGRRARWLLWPAYGAIALGGAALTGLIIHRWVAGGHPPLSGLFDAVIFFSWTTVISFGVAEMVFRTRWLAVLLAAVEVAMLNYAADCDPAIQPLMPVLQSTWLHIHVFCYMFAYGIMTLGCFTAVCFYVYLGKSTEGELRRKFDDLTYRFLAFGFPLLTVGVITGAVWADRTWGRYWGWDPKETWSLITWIVYATYLHLSFLSRSWKVDPRRRGAYLNWMAIVGFGAIITTFLLLKYLPSSKASLHIYLE